MSSDPPPAGARNEDARIAWVGQFARRARGWLHEASRSALAGGMHVAGEGDRWFVAAARGLDQGADAVAGTLGTQLARLRPSFLRRRTPRERIEQLLRNEARRFDFDVRQEAFDAFAARIATLLELVYTGVVRLDDVMFESAEPGQQVSEPEKGDEAHGADQVHEPGDAAP